MLFARLLDRTFRHGHLTVVDAHGRSHRFGGEPLPGVGPVTVTLHDPALHRRLWFSPGLAVGEGYMDGTLRLAEGSLHDFLALAIENIGRSGRDRGLTWFEAAGGLLRRLQQFNPVARARRNVAHHYDLSDQLYGRFLDADRQYSCAYFCRPGMSLDAAQEAKKRHIATKLLMEPGMRVLDIGCGWGGLSLSLARDHGAEVVGITLSEEQLRIARRRAAESGLDDRVRFELRDYRAQEGRFDRIVSVGMFEHVGINHFATFFRRLRDLLSEDGVALLHSIGRSTGPGTTHPWIRRYIFPGGYIPALSEVLPKVERSRLQVTDIEILRLHYAETLNAWWRRFQAERRLVAEIYDERFCRMWEFYLAASEAAFRHGGMMVFQMQLARRVDTVPLTRDYLLLPPQGEGERSAAE